MALRKVLYTPFQLALLRKWLRSAADTERGFPTPTVAPKPLWVLTGGME